MTGRRRFPDSRSLDPNQFQFDWGESKAEKPSAKSSPAVTTSPESSAAAPPTVAAAPLIQYLPWDFENSFPEPLPEAIKEGVLEEDDPDTVRWIHQEHAREGLAVLHELDIVMDARIRGVDPQTNKMPSRPQAKERLAKFFKTEPTRLENWFRSLMGPYEDAFGADAANAFEKAIRAWHAGIPVAAESSRPPVQIKSTRSNIAPPQLPTARNPSRSAVARLPGPKPLASAIAAGHFGKDDDGRPVRPGSHEVRAITERHAEKLIELLDSMASARGNAKDEFSASFTAGIAAYAEDFGPRAARQLEAYVCRQAGLDSTRGRKR